jgi:hypothetical protein
MTDAEQLEAMYAIGAGGISTRRLYAESQEAKDAIKAIYDTAAIYAEFLRTRPVLASWVCEDCGSDYDVCNCYDA